ncbi:MAG: hypothetical protein Q9196_003906 [Gyalolechia fulgens]
MTTEVFSDTGHRSQDDDAINLQFIVKTKEQGALDRIRDLTPDRRLQEINKAIEADPDVGTEPGPLAREQWNLLRHRVTSTRVLKSRDVETITCKPEDAEVLPKAIQWVKFFGVEVVIQTHTFGPVAHTISTSTTNIQGAERIRATAEALVAANITKWAIPFTPADVRYVGWQRRNERSNATASLSSSSGPRNLPTRELTMNNVITAKDTDTRDPAAPHLEDAPVAQKNTYRPTPLDWDTQQEEPTLGQQLKKIMDEIQAMKEQINAGLGNPRKRKAAAAISSSTEERPAKIFRPNNKRTIIRTKKAMPLPTTHQQRRHHRQPHKPRTAARAAAAPTPRTEATPHQAKALPGRRGGCPGR